MVGNGSFVATPAQQRTSPHPLPDLPTGVVMTGRPATGPAGKAMTGRVSMQPPGNLAQAQKAIFIIAVSAQAARARA